MVLKIFGSHNFQTNELVQKYLSKEQITEIEVVGSILPFKVNNYVINELIDWKNVPNDPIFRLVFPQKDMLADADFEKVKTLLEEHGNKSVRFKEFANQFYKGRNPHSSNQLSNIPEFNGDKILGMQHKYEDTVLFFPKHGQTCHSYCTFCFRWPQFVESDNHKFAMNEVNVLIDYLRGNPRISDVILTGGDPMVMSAKVLRNYIHPLINAGLENLKTIRIGTKSLGFWPYRFVSDSDSNELLNLFSEVVDKGYNLSIMAHFSHYRELKTTTVVEAIKRIRATGTQIWAQSPILKGINDSVEVWRNMWRELLNLGVIPYYMFVPRDTGAHNYFALPLNKIISIYNEVIQDLSGLCKIANGPVMSTEQGKIQVVGITEILNEKVFVLKFLRARNSRLVGHVFFARWDDSVEWFDDLILVDSEMSNKVLVV